MFYDKFLDLCAQKGVSQTAACVNAGLSESAWKRWIDGGAPNSISVGKLSRYFGVTIQSLYDENESPVIHEDETIKERQAAFDRPEMRVLFDTAKDVPASKIYEVITMLEKYTEESASK